MPFELRVRDLRTGENSVAEFETPDAAHAWLKERPRFVEALGVATYGVSAEVSAKLRAASRPLDEEERKLEKILADAVEAAAQARVALEQKKSQAAAAEHRAAQATADPNRTMEIHWTFDRGMELVDKADPRAITEDAKLAVLAWIAERNDWVKERGQIVGDATLTVWPGPLPAKAGGERIERGRFIPVTAPPPNESQN